MTERDTNLDRDGFLGRFDSSAPTQRQPAILILGGSFGGFPYPPIASLLASRGYPTLALAYFGEPGLPRELARIPLEYFEKALRWLGAQPGVDPSRIVVLGASRGAELALLLGSVFPQLVHGVAAYSPSEVVYPALGGRGPAWTLRGKPFAPASDIPVEKIAGPLFLVAGRDDHVWGSFFSAQNVVRRLRDHSRSDVTFLSYRFAGHAVNGVVPNVSSSRFVPGSHGLLDLGGSPQADAAARAASWPRLLRFLGSLRSG